MPSLGSVPLVRLAPADVRRLLATCTRGGLSARSIGHVHATLRTAVGAALRDGQVIRNVAALVTAPPAPKPRVRPIGPDNARAILAAVEGDRLAPLVAVTLGVGLRLGEALGLRWSDVDLDAGTLAIRTALRRTPVEFREEGEPIYRLDASEDRPLEAHDPALRIRNRRAPRSAPGPSRDATRRRPTVAG